ncbi:MAG: EAL domain-containing protein [Actinomycetota bacterium]|nr:EAL domain-containing protein [Actinomycetota bacterium]
MQQIKLLGLLAVAFLALPERLDSMGGQSDRRLTLETGLRRAVEREEFGVLYQPVVRLADGRDAGAEALVRWRHPERGVVPPSAFVPLAEETGLILKIGEQVLREACARAREWRALRQALRQGSQDDGGASTVWVNLSARQFHEPGISELVEGVLEESGLGPGSLGLEITEGFAMAEAGFGTGRTAATLRNLKELGVRLAVDDFGTGYSSLSYLKRLPLDVLKIDRSFVSGLERDAGDRAIVSAVATLARDMELEVVAEGAETEEQLRILRELGCDLAQGYYFARPLPAAEVFTRLDGGLTPATGL